MGTLFRIERSTHAQSTTADSITIDVPAGRYLFLHNAEITGMASAAAVGAEFGVYRQVTTLGSGGAPTSLVIKPADPNGAGVPSGFTARYGYTTQPTVEADPVVQLDYQPFGGKARSLSSAGPIGFWLATAYQVCFRGKTGTPNIALGVEVELL